MSFEVGPIRPQPSIQSAQRMQNDGGGGNLGYMQQERKKKEEEDQNDELLLDDDSSDSIQLTLEGDFTASYRNKKKEEEPKKESFSPKKFFDNIVDKLSDKVAKQSKNPFSNPSTQG